MTKLSVVIICHNEASIIKKCILAAKSISDDVVVVDSFSTDDTPSICQSLDIHFVQQEWLGYGAQKNFGNTLAKHDWVVSLDADEVLTAELIAEIKNLGFAEEKKVYKINRQNYFGEKKINFGGLSRDFVRRIFNRKSVAWDTKKVHEDLVLNKGQKVLSLQNKLDHFSIKNVAQYSDKSLKYAQLFAAQKQKEGKKASLLKRFGSPIFKFVKDYIFRLGFLDGREGWQIAKILTRETYIKYKLLHQMNQENR